MITDKCPDCHGELEKGVLLDQTYGAITAGRYAKAEIPDGPNRKFMFVLESDFTDVRRIVAQRCMNCNKIVLHAQNTVVVSSVNKRTRKMFAFFIGFSLLIVIVGLIISSNP